MSASFQIYWMTLAVIAIGCIPFYVYAIDDLPLLYWLVLEDGLVESIGHLAFISASTVFFVSAALAWNQVSPESRRLGITLAIFGGFMFVLYGEETSWLQRFLGLETPEWLSDINYQNEINIHNITFLNFTLHALTIYMLASCLFLSIAATLIRSFAPARNWSRRWSILPAPKSVACGTLVLTILYFAGNKIIQDTTQDIFLLRAFDEFIESISALLWLGYAISCARHVGAIHAGLLTQGSQLRWPIGMGILAILLAFVLQIAQFRAFVQYPESRQIVGQSYLDMALQLAMHADGEPDTLAYISTALQKAVRLGCRDSQLSHLYIERELELARADVASGDQGLAMMRYALILLFEGDPELHPAIVDALREQAELFLSQGDYDLAINRADRALNYDPTTKHVLMWRGIALALSGRVLEAQADLENFIQETPAAANKLRLFLTRELINHGELALAESYLREFTQDIPSNSEVLELIDLWEMRNLFQPDPVPEHRRGQ